MFYGIPKDRKEDFKSAIKTLQEIYEGKFFAQDMLICLWRNLSFLSDDKFMQSYKNSVTNEQEGSLAWRLHTLIWAAQNTFALEGDYVECGVFKGFCSSVLFDYLEFEKINKNAFLYDTFNGLPEQTSTELERKLWVYSQTDHYLFYKDICEKFSKYKNVKVIKGIVPDSFSIACPEKISLLHIDMNSEQAEILALDFLFDKVVPGGMIILDDFGWTCNSNQMHAELEFMQKRNHSILELPTGQGLVIKHN